MNTLVTLLEQQNYRGAIVGPHGHGKSTLLVELAAKLELSGKSTHSLRLNEETRSRNGQLVQDWLRTVTSGQILLLDGAEQLSHWQWWRIKRLSKQYAGLIVTAHRHGILPTVYECRTSPELLTELVQELNERHPIPAQLDVSLTHQRHQGNIRECLRAFYDQCASHPS
ncbi:hypothetical protein [Planctomicrobium sp. SH527]|uniref:hypothetical protein n=1 Tax=Planctomicrobium sp. SH527 TaxID=3448123 RepID=UPI003F5C9566